MINKKIICIFSLLLCTLACSCVNTTNTIKTKYINSKWEKHSEGKYEIISSTENMINYLNNLETENDKTEFSNYYNEKYFSNKQVIALKLEENSKDNINELTSYEIKNNELIIRIKTKTYGTTMEMSNMVVFLTLYNEEMQNFGNVKIIKNNTLILAEEVNEQRISYLQKELQIDVHDSSNLEIIINSYEKFNEFIDSDNAECYISREELLTIYNEEYFNEKALIYVSKRLVGNKSTLNKVLIVLDLFTTADFFEFLSAKKKMPLPHSTVFSVNFSSLFFNGIIHLL